MLLGYTRQSFYQGIKEIKQLAYQEDVIIDEILRHRKLQKRLGTRKLFSEMNHFLNAHNFKIGRDGLFNLMREKGLLIRRRRRSGPITTLSKHRFRRYPNIIRDFVPTGPNQLWVSDITYITLHEGFGYLSLITDAYSRKIVGYSLQKNLSANGPLLALEMALRNNPEREHLIHHSDRGVQYCCDAYIKTLVTQNIKISMTENGDPLENAIAERLNGILKQELMEEVYPTLNEAEQHLPVVCSTYNHLRPHNSINNLKPAEAHQIQGTLQRKWKNYYKSRAREEVSRM